MRQGEPGWVAAVATSADEARGLSFEHLEDQADLVLIETVVLGEHQACSTCAAVTQCPTTRWEDFRRGEPDGPEPPEGRSVVHTCKSCFRKVYGLGFMAAAAQVPDGCPRWNPMFGSAFDCADCDAERRAMRDAHPARAAQDDAAVGLLNWVHSSRVRKAGLPEGVESLDSTRELHDVCLNLVEHGAPFRHVAPTDDEVVLATTLVEAFLAAAMRESAFVQEAAANETWDTTLHGFMWIEGMILAIRRHGRDPAKVVREWSLLFNDRPPWSRAWVRVSVTRRRLLIRGWEAVVREAFGQAP